MNFADQEEIAQRQKNRGKKRRHDVLWNSLTAVFIIASVAAVGYFLVLFSNPASAMNPYPPPTMPALIQIPTATLTPVILPPTWTPTPSATATQMPDAGTTAFTPADQTPAITEASTSSGDFLFSMKGNPVGMTNTTFHPSLDCNWQGVAGKVTDIQGKAVSNLTVHLKGYYNGKSVDQMTLSGGAAKWIGDGGYEIVLELGSPPLASTGQLTIQLEDTAYVPLSEKVTFDTYAECEKNLILINFQQTQ